MFIEIKRSLTTVRKVHHSLIYCSSGRASLARQLLSVWQRVTTTVAKPYAPSQTRPSDIISGLHDVCLRKYRGQEPSILTSPPEPFSRFISRTVRSTCTLMTTKRRNLSTYLLAAASKCVKPPSKVIPELSDE